MAFRFGDCRSAGWPPGSRLPLFGMHRFGDCPRRVGFSAFRFGDSRSSSWPSGSLLPLFGMHRFGVALGELALPPSASEMAAGRVALRAHCFRFSACAASGLRLGGLAFGLIASAFRHAPLRGLPSAGWFFRSASWPSGSRLPLFGLHRFGVAVRRVGLRAHGFRFLACTASEIALGGFVLPPSVSEMAAGRVGLRAHDFRFSACADPHRRTAEARTDGAHRHDTCFTSKHLSQHVNLPHRSP